LEIVPVEDLSSEFSTNWITHSDWSQDSIKVISAGRLYIKSKAIAEVMRTARWYAQPLRMIFLLPDRWLDLGYDWVARHRKSQACDFVIKKD
jgi:predicted DCC family thiol-disulfide oxidoreductase YuxK